MTEMEQRGAVDRFPSPFDIQTPEGAEGWERMYPYYLLFSEENREWEDSVLWFLDNLHMPEVELPFDTIAHEAWTIGLGQNNSRIFALPPAYGIEQRMLNGRLYVTSVPVTDEEWVGERVDIFMRRAGHYYQNWDDIFERWKAKMDKLIAGMKAIEVPELLRLEPEEVVTEARGISSGFELLTAYDDAMRSVFTAYQYHFEMLNIGYAAYLNLFQFCKQAFPGIKDDVITQMVAGSEILFFRPDDELKKLARLALELGIENTIRQNDPDTAIEKLGQDANGRQWVEALEAAKDPWFSLSNGTNLYHHHRSWLDDMTVPWAAMTGYIGKLEQGESIERPREEILQRRERLASEYAQLLQSDEDRTAFEQNVGLARTVAAYIEDHNFFVEHRHGTEFWRKMREFADRLVTGGFLDDREDVFYLNRWEVGQALYEMVSAWATGAQARGTKYWPREVEERKKIIDALRADPPPPALGPPPEEITEPITVMLFGITTEVVQGWLGSESDEAANEVKGVPGSPGVVEGTARVIMAASDLDHVEVDDILICPVTNPSWGPVFGSIKATVSDIGGVMSHAAIVSREYGLPAVVGTGTGTRKISSGDRVQVDGDSGIVTILQGAGSGE